MYIKTSAKTSTDNSARAFDGGGGGGVRICDNYLNLMVPFKYPSLINLTTKVKIHVLCQMWLQKTAWYHCAVYRNPQKVLLYLS